MSHRFVYRVFFAALLVGAVRPESLFAKFVTGFPLPSQTCQPIGIVAGPDGALWATEFSAGKIARMTTAGVVSEYALPNSAALPLAITRGPDGNLWFTEYDGDKIGRITSSGVLAEFGLAPGASPYAITAGPDGNLWFAEYGGQKIGKMTTSGTLVEFPVSGSPTGIAAGSDGALWFTEFTANKIGRITVSGIVTDFALPTPDSGPLDITPGPDGNLWFLESSANKVGRITPAGGITEFPVPSAASGLTTITSADGYLYFTERAMNQIGRVSVAGAFAEFPVFGSYYGNSQPGGITKGPDGKIWTTHESGGQILRVNVQDRLVLFAIPRPDPNSNPNPGGIAPGWDGNVWFTEPYLNRIGRITPLGVVTEFPVPTASANPGAMTKGPDGNVWFTEYSKVGRITPSGVITEFPIPFSPRNITTGPDGNLWMILGQSAGIDQVGRMTPGGVLDHFDAPGSYYGDITGGPDGNVWYTRSGGVGRITPSGSVANFFIPNGSGDFIISHSDGNLWFTSPYNGLNRMTTTGIITSFQGLSSGPIASGSDQNLWLGNYGVLKVTSSGVLAAYFANDFGPTHMTSGPDGNVWFTSYSGYIGKVLVAEPSLKLFTMTPCRLVDTRDTSGPYGTGYPNLYPNDSRYFLLTGKCGVPPNAKSVSANVTVTNVLGLGELRMGPSQLPDAAASTISFRTGISRANSAILSLGTANQSYSNDGGIRVTNASDSTVDLIIDVNGYFE